VPLQFRAWNSQASRLRSLPLPCPIVSGYFIKPLSSMTRFFAFLVSNQSRLYSLLFDLSTTYSLRLSPTQCIDLSQERERFISLQFPQSIPEVFLSTNRNQATTSVSGNTFSNTESTLFEQCNHHLKSAEHIGSPCISLFLRGKMERMVEVFAIRIRQERKSYLS
jgi:hypothetical protein